MVGRDPEIGQNAVDPADPAQTQRPAQEAEVALDVVETRVLGAVRPGIAVLIEGVEAPFGPQIGKDAARMSASAEREVGVGPLRHDTEQAHRLFQKHGCMIERHGCGRQRSIWV